MKISVICWFRNDSFLAPFFLNHYSFADEIIILLDDVTTDNTAKIVLGYPNTKIVTFNSDNANVSVTMKAYNSLANKSDSDWVICACNDEFAFPNGGRMFRSALDKVNGNVIYSDMWQVYRNVKDGDLDSTIPTIWQRRHGDVNRTEGINALYQKPIIFNPRLGIEMGMGMHACVPNPKIKISTTRFDGAHWLMADPYLAVLRRMRGARKFQNKENLRHGWGHQHFDITEEWIRGECAKHLNDPQLF